MVERLSGGSGRKLAEDIGRAGRMVKSLNLTTILKNIENKAEGPKPVRIDPEILIASQEMITLTDSTASVQ
jgi:hypothetical protein